MGSDFSNSLSFSNCSACIRNQLILTLHFVHFQLMGSKNIFTVCIKLHLLHQLFYIIPLLFRMPAQLSFEVKEKIAVFPLSCEKCPFHCSQPSSFLFRFHLLHPGHQTFEQFAEMNVTLAANIAQSAVFYE